MIEMVRRFVRQKFTSPGIAIALGALALLETMGWAFSGGQRDFTVASWGIFLLAAGSVSRDAGSGALQMILSRPIRRTRYLFGRYLGIVLSFAAFLTATCLLILLARAGAVRSGAASEGFAGALGAAAGATFFNAVLQGAILLFFSTFLPGLADLLGFLLLFLALNLPRASRAEWLRRAAEVLRENMIPAVDWNEVLRGVGVLGPATGRWVFALAVHLVLAAVVFSRRELPYGQD